MVLFPWPVLSLAGVFIFCYIYAHSDSGHQSFSLLWATLRALRRCFFLIDLKLHIRIWHYRISDASLAYCACVCVWTLWDVGLTSDQAVTGSLFLSSTILLLKLVMNYYLQSFPFLLIERRTVVSYWQNLTPGPFVSIRWEHLGIYIFTTFAPNQLGHNLNADPVE